MTNFKRLCAALLALMLLLAPTSALAAGSIDVSADAALTISCGVGALRLSGAPLRVYRIADVDACGELTPTEDFAAFDVDIHGENDEAWLALTETLVGHIRHTQPAPAASGSTGTDGNLTLTGLKPGLYLVLGQVHAQGGWFCEPIPFLVHLPALNAEENIWEYNVTASPKFDATPIPAGTLTRKVLKVWDDEGLEDDRPASVTVELYQDDTLLDTVTLSAENNWRWTWDALAPNHSYTVYELTPEGYTASLTSEGITFVLTNTANAPEEPVGPEDPDITDIPDEPVPGGGLESGDGGESGLPQTGQLWWPVPVLAAAGLALVLLGLLRRRGTRHET